MIEKKEKGNHCCTICGNTYDNIAFKGGYICEDCVSILKRIYKE